MGCTLYHGSTEQGNLSPCRETRRGFWKEVTFKLKLDRYIGSLPSKGEVEVR